MTVIINKSSPPFLRVVLYPGRWLHLLIASYLYLFCFQFNIWNTLHLLIDVCSYENTKSSTTNSGGQCIRCSAPLSPVCHACSLSSQGNFSEASPISRPFHPDIQFVSELSSSAQEGAKALTDHKVKNTDKSTGRKAEAVLTRVLGGKSAEPVKTRQHSADGIVTTGNVFGVPEWSQRRKRIIRSLERRTRGQHRQNKLKSKCAVRAEIALVCSICGEQFKKSDNLVSHFHQQHHGEKKPFKCVHCDTKLSSIISLTVHVRRHTGEKPFVCQICSAAFAQSSHLIGHKLTHSGYKPYKCVECGTSFSSSSHLTVHMRSHSGVRPFLCHECGAAFTASGHLKVHMRKHTGERPFVCNECGAAFSQSGNLREHKKKHEDKVNIPKVPPERNFICTQCGATFIRANHMKVHMRKHSDERPFRCKDCGKAFFESSSLKSHTRIHTGEKPFKCNQCDAAFANSSNLKVHTRKHTGEKPFSCEICGATFTQSNSVHTHMRRKHMNSLA